MEEGGHIAIKKALLLELLAAAHPPKLRIWVLRDAEKAEQKLCGSEPKYWGAATALQVWDYPPKNLSALYLYMLPLPCQMQASVPAV